MAAKEVLVVVVLEWKKWEQVWISKNTINRIFYSFSLNVEKDDVYLVWYYVLVKPKKARFYI